MAQMFAVFVVIPPPIFGLKAQEKQIGGTFNSEADALHALSLTKAPNGGKLEVRVLNVLSDEEKRALENAKAMEKEAAKAVRSAKSSLTRDVKAIAKAILLTGKSVDDPMLANLPAEIRDMVLAKIAELSLPENRAKAERESAPKARYKPLMLSGLALAIGVEKLDEVAPFPKRPDSWDGLLGYFDALSSFKKALERWKPLQGPDHGENALNRAAYRRALNRIQSELELVNYHMQSRRVENVTSDVSYQGKRFVEYEAGIMSGIMPDWPKNEKSENSPERNASENNGETSEESSELDILAGMNEEEIKAARKAAEKRAKINSVVRNEMGPGFQFKPVCARRDFSRGTLSWQMSVRNDRAVFSKG